MLKKNKKKLYFSDNQYFNFQTIFHRDGYEHKKVNKFTIFDIFCVSSQIR